MRVKHIDYFRQARLVVAGAIAVLFIHSGTVLAQQSSDSKVVDGLLAYFAVVPSQIVGVHPPSHPEATMHGGVPTGKKSHHVVVALFDKEGVDRVTDAEVYAIITEVGLAGRTKKLEPFTVNDALTYGNYFNFTPRTRYRVIVSVRAPGKAAEIKFEFDYQHR